MRRLTILHLVLSLGSLLTTSLPAAAFDGDSDFGPVSTTEQFEGVAKPRPQEGMLTPLEDPVLQPYEVFFGEQYARIDNLESDGPSAFETEFMVIEVKEGIFALEVGEEGTFIVDPAGDAPIQFVELPAVATPPYVIPLPQFVRNTAGSICTSMCSLPHGKAVQLKPGDLVIAQALSSCLWCLLHGTESALNQTSGQGDAIPDSGLLLVSAQIPVVDPTSFSWLANWTEGGSEATPEALNRSVTMTWAFNPPSGCHRSSD